MIFAHLSLLVATVICTPRTYATSQIDGAQCGDKQLFVEYRTPLADHQYWLFEARNNTGNAPVILWINGVPDQPPIFGTSAGMSPCKLKDDVTLERNLFAWNLNAHLLFFDMYTISAEEKPIGRYRFLFNFILELCKKYPQYVQTGIHIFGQSYDSVVAAVVGNMVAKYSDSKIKVKLLSVGLGSPIIDMRTQMRGYPEMFNTISNNEGIYTAMKKDLDKLNPDSEVCAKLFKKVDCKKYAQSLADVAFAPYLSIYPSLIDYKTNGYANLNALIVNSNQFLLTNKLFKSATNLSNASFRPNRENIFESHNEEIATLVSAHIPVLIYSGENDYIANKHGMLLLLNEYNWKNFTNPKTLTCIIETWSASNLTYALIRDAGHLTQVDQPESLAFLIQTWIVNTTPKLNY